MKIGQLISLVKERPLLYNTHNPINNRKEKEEMWREIATAMNIHCDIAKSRWKSLKDCYTKYLKSKMATGPTAYLKYINWQWAEHMEFMKPHIKFGLILTNIALQDSQDNDNLDNQSSSDVQGYQSSSELLEEHERYKTPERSESMEKTRIHDGPGSNERAGSHESSGSQERPKTRNISRSNGKTFGKVRRRRGAMISDLNTSPKRDTIIQYLDSKKTNNFSATELIFLGYSKSIKTFSIRRQAEIKMKIAKIMMEEEIAHFEENMSHSEYDHR